MATRMRTNLDEMTQRELILAATAEVKRANEVILRALAALQPQTARRANFAVIDGGKRDA